MDAWLVVETHFNGDYTFRRNLCIYEDYEDAKQFIRRLPKKMGSEYSAEFLEYFPKG